MGETSGGSIKASSGFQLTTGMLEDAAAANELATSHVHKAASFKDKSK